MKRYALLLAAIVILGVVASGCLGGGSSKTPSSTSGGKVQPTTSSTATTSSPTASGSTSHTTTSPTSSATSTSPPTSSETTTSETSSTTSSPAPQAPMINFSAYRSRGSVIGSWRELFNASRVYTVPGYWDLVKNYLPNASVEDVSVYKWGIAVLPPELGIKLLSPERVRIERVDYFGYVLYRNGYHFVGPDKGIIAVFNSNYGKRLIVTGTSRAGVGLALRELVRIHSTSDVPSFYVYRYGQFEALALKEIGDVNWDGIVEKGEYVRDYPLYYDEPFQFYWRVVGGENVSVRGAFIRLVNGSTVYLHALGFSVNVSVRPSGKNLTFVIENVNPSYLDYPKCASVNGTTIRITSTSGFIIKPLPVSNYTVIAFGDHRPAHRDDPVPAVFRKIVKEVNNRSAAFVIDNGDLVYSGRLREWVDLMQVWHWNKPIFVSPGNHEYQGEGRNIYHYLFGPAEDFAFTLGGFGYVFLDDVDNGYTLSPDQWAFLGEWLKKDNETGRRTVIIAHAPPYDPRSNGHHTMNEASAKKLLSLMREYGSFGIFSHIHMNWYGTYDGVQMIITGGAGAPLYVTDPSKGGFYGYAVLGMEKDGNIKVSFVRVG